MSLRLLLLIALASLFPQAGALTPGERALTTFIDANNEAALALVERVVNINSGTMNFAGVQEVGKVFRAEFDGLGFKTEWVDGAPFGRAGHLVAEHPGRGPRILLIGHLDTVFEPDSPFQKYERISPTAARGPGITDMKGGNVVMLHALKALQSTGQLTSMNIVVVLTGDEESAGRPLTQSRAALVKAAQGADVAIGFEDGDGNPATAVIARRGTTNWELRVKGKPAHSSQIFNAENGYGAVFETARMILDGVGLMGTGGHTVNETADLRTLPAMTKRMAVLLSRLQRDRVK